MWMDALPSYYQDAPYAQAGALGTGNVVRYIRGVTSYKLGQMQKTTGI